MDIYKHQDSNIRKTWFFVTLFLVLVIGVGWVFAQIYETPVILYGAFIFAIVMNVFSYWYSDKIVLSLARAKPVTREEHMELWNITENLAITAGLPMPRLYIIDDPAPNAFATGRNAEHAVVAVTTGLLSVLDRSELEGVIAHELSHVGNKDMLLSTMVVVLVGFVSIVSDLFLRTTRFSDSRDSRAGGIMFLIGIILAILAPLVAVIMQLAISRKREFLADASGALLTRYPEGLASALRKISSYPAGMKRVNNATAHLYISNPHGPKKKKTSFFVKLFMTHPPIEERISALMNRREI